MGRNLAFISAAAPRAGQTPEARAVTKANWAEPENTSAERAITTAGESPAWTAYAPNVTARAKEAAARLAPTAMPRDQELVGIHMVYQGLAHLV